MLGYAQRNLQNARNLRVRMTEAEQRLWRHLRHDQFGVRFYRQKPLGPFIVDFYSHQARLVIELDGSQHQDDPAIKEQDWKRDAWLLTRGLRVLRFNDRQVLTETMAVLELIHRVVENATGGEIPPRPPLKRGGMPRPSAERSLPFPKGGQEGFDDGRQSDQAQE